MSTFVKDLQEEFSITGKTNLQTLIRERGKRKVALYHAFHTSLPIMAGYGFLGLTTLKVRTTLRLSPRRAKAEL